MQQWRRTALACACFFAWFGYGSDHRLSTEVRLGCKTLFLRKLDVWGPFGHAADVWGHGVASSESREHEIP
jgi:hypothetical protein